MQCWGGGQPPGGAGVLPELQQISRLETWVPLEKMEVSEVGLYGIPSLLRSLLSPDCRSQALLPNLQEFPSPELATLCSAEIAPSETPLAAGSLLPGEPHYSSVLPSLQDAAFGETHPGGYYYSCGLHPPSLPLMHSTGYSPTLCNTEDS